MFQPSVEKFQPSVAGFFRLIIFSAVPVSIPLWREWLQWFVSLVVTGRAAYCGIPIKSIEYIIVNFPAKYDWAKLQIERVNHGFQ